MISVIVPVYNEAANIPMLYERLKKVLEGLSTEYEILFVDDGSTDNSYALLKQIADANTSVTLICLHRNFGQTAAIQAGIDYAQSQVIIILDADLQNPPEEIPKLLQKFSEGYDCVSGWRVTRKDKYLTKVLPSQAANKIISYISKLHLHDFGCTLKVYNAHYLKKLYLNGDMHRFLPVFIHNLGGKVTELPIEHHPRLYEKSKYSILKSISVILELSIITFMQNYSNKPIHFVGFLGLICILASCLILAKLISNIIFHYPLSAVFLLYVVLFISGIMFFLAGVIIDILVKMYNKIDNSKIYVVREVIRAH